MKRGEIWTASGGPNYASKPRPVVIVQNDFFDATASITVCPFTRSTAGAGMIRLAVENSAANGLESQSFLMVDKIGTLPRTKLGQPLGMLGRTDMIRLERAMLTFLGLIP